MAKIIGQRFGKLTLTRKAPIEGIERPSRFVEVLCDCGTTKVIYLANLGRSTFSCGCVHKAGDSYVKHGHTRIGKRTRTYRVWVNIKSRLTNPKASSYKFYGGRDLDMAPAWEDFAVFLADMGECPPGMTIERRNNDLGYWPNNCYWATPKAQANNRRSSRWLTLDETTLTMTQWSEKTGIGVGTIWKRLDNGWSVKEALTTVCR